MKLQILIDFLNKWAPESDAESWDNVGLQIGDRNAQIKHIVLAMDVDRDLLSYLSNNPADLVITHHPLLFSSVKSVDKSEPLGEAIYAFINKNCGLYSMHTNLDKADNGINDALIKQYGLDPKQGTWFDGGIGKWFDVESGVTEQTSNAFIKGNKGIVVGNKKDRIISRVGFCGGSGKSLLGQIRDLSIDLFITGELGYHDEVNLGLSGSSAFLMGHKESEFFGLYEIKEYINNSFSEVDVKVFGR